MHQAPYYRLWAIMKNSGEDRRRSPLLFTDIKPSASDSAELLPMTNDDASNLPRPLTGVYKNSPPGKSKEIRTNTPSLITVRTLNKIKHPVHIHVLLAQYFLQQLPLYKIKSIQDVTTSYVYLLTVSIVIVCHVAIRELLGIY